MKQPPVVRLDRSHNSLAMVCLSAGSVPGCAPGATENWIRLLGEKPRRTRSAATSRRPLSNTSDGAPECEWLSADTTIAAQSLNPAPDAGTARNAAKIAAKTTPMTLMNVPRSPLESSTELNMRRPQDLVYGGHRPDAVAPVEQDSCVTREAVGVTGDIGKPRHLRPRQLPRLRLGPGAWRVEHHGIELVQLQRRQRRLEQVAALGGDGLQALRPLGPRGQRLEHLRLAFHGVHPRPLRQRQRESAGTAEQVGDGLGAPFTGAK